MNAISKIRTSQQMLVIIIFFMMSIIGFGVAYTLSNKQNVAAQDATSCKGICVALHENKANPNTIAVPRGSNVQFNSSDGKSHSLSLGDGGENHDHHGKFSSGVFKADEAWQAQFNEEGSFKFHDHFNPKINVLVVVFTPGKDYKIRQ